VPAQPPNPAPRRSWPKLIRQITDIPSAILDFFEAIADWLIAVPGVIERFWHRRKRAVYGMLIVFGLALIAVSVASLRLSSAEPDTPVISPPPIEKPLPVATPSTPPPADESVSEHAPVEAPPAAPKTPAEGAWEAAVTIKDFYAFQQRFGADAAPGGRDAFSSAVFKRVYRFHTGYSYYHRVFQPGNRYVAYLIPDQTSPAISIEPAVEARDLAAPIFTAPDGTEWVKFERKGETWPYAFVLHSAIKAPDPDPAPRSRSYAAPARQLTSASSACLAFKQGLERSRFDPARDSSQPVTLSYDLDAAGRVTNLRFIDATSTRYAPRNRFQAAAAMALQQLQFSPALDATGQPIPSPNQSRRYIFREIESDDVARSATGCAS
jgi:hypothetical protein